MKKIYVPYIKNLENLNFEQLQLELELKGSKDYIDCANWEKEYPYKPTAVFSIARSDNSLAILYHVRGLDLRAANLEDNGSVWEDSCCEFFVADPKTNIYYNFEMNCIGTILNGIGENRENRERRNPLHLQRIIRFSSLPHQKYEQNNTIFEWNVAMLIPFDMFGVDSANLPKSLKANFYKCADKSANVHFLSWNPIQTPKPDFHRKDFFGEIIFDF